MATRLDGKPHRGGRVGLVMLDLPHKFAEPAIFLEAGGGTYQQRGAPLQHPF